jgi:hypothetical protein
MQAKPLFALAFALASALTLSPAGHAAVLTGSSVHGGNAVADYSTPGAVSFDLDLEHFAPTRLDFRLEADDLLGPLSLNAIVRNLSGAALTAFDFRLEGIRFAQAGSVTPTFGTLGRIAYGSDYASIDFQTPEWAEFHVGDPLGAAGATDWLLNTAGLRAGDTFSITAEVPEPSTAALMLSSLCMSGLLALRRRQRG